MKSHRQNWLDIFSTFRVALDTRKMVLGMFGAFFSAAVLLAALGIATRWWPNVLVRIETALRLPGVMLVPTPQDVGGRLLAAACNPTRGLGEGPGYPELLFVGVVGLAMLLVWALIGGAIARLAAVDFARDERLSLADGFAFAMKKYGSFVWSPLVPGVFIVILLCCNAVLGLVGRIPAVGPVVVGLFFWLAALSSFVIILIAIGGLFGQIFMWPTIAMEGTDAFDAVSRSFAYLYSRPWKTIWCCLVEMVYGAICLGFSTVFAGLLLWIARASVHFGMGGGRFGMLHSLWNLPIGSEASVAEAIGMVLVRVVFIMTWGMVLGLVVSFKISAAVSTYAVIRRDVDGTDMSEVFLPEPEESLESGEKPGDAPAASAPNGTKPTENAEKEPKKEG